MTKKRNRIGDDTLEQVTIVNNFAKSRFYDFEKLVQKMIAVQASAASDAAKNEVKD